MKRSRYEEYCERKFGLQQRVPDRVCDQYETALIALVNARYHDATRHFGWFRAAERQLRIAAASLAQIDGISQSRAPVRQVRRPVVRRLSVALAGSMMVMSAFLLGLRLGSAPPPTPPGISAAHNATNTNSTSTNVTVSNTSGCGVGTNCGDAVNENAQSASTGNVTVTNNNP